VSVLTPGFLSVVPQFLSTDAETSVCGLQGLLRLCFAQEPSVSELYLMLGYNVSSRRMSVRGCSLVLSTTTTSCRRFASQVLITHGVADAIVKRAAVDQHKAAMPHAQVQLMASALRTGL
jgi:hypothetical protein